MVTGSSYPDKIVDKKALIELMAGARRQGQTIVLCHGCFDIVHPGHIRHLEFARTHGDKLVVSITGDAAIDKGADRPYVPEELRARSLAALEFVDWVYVDPTHTATDILQAVKPEVYVKGQEYQGSTDPRFLEERGIVEGYGGKVIYSSGDIVFSSTELIRRIGRDPRVETERLEHLCLRHRVDQDSMSDIIARFSSQRVMVVGDLVIDRYVSCDPLDIAREAPMMTLKQLDENTYVGGAGIVARHLAGLGAQVSLFSSLGQGELSKMVLRELGREGIETQSLLKRPQLVVKTRYLVEETKLFRVEQSENRPLDSRSIKKAKKSLLAKAAEVDAVVFCDFGYGVITEGLLAEVLADMRSMVGVLTADVSGSRANLLNFHGVDLFCPTERELRATLHHFEQGLSTVAHEVLQATQAKHLITTLGRRGLVVFDRQSQDPTSPGWDGRLRSEHLQPINGRAVDALGCGDALLAGCTLALCCGAGLIQAAYIGNLMAGIEAGEVGNIPINMRMLRQCLDTRPELVSQRMSNSEAMVENR